MGKWLLGPRMWEHPLPQVSLSVWAGVLIDPPKTGVLGEATGRQSLSLLNRGLSLSAHKPVSAKVRDPRVAPKGNSSDNVSHKAPDQGLHPGQS